MLHGCGATLFITADNSTNSLRFFFLPFFPTFPTFHIVGARECSFAELRGERSPLVICVPFFDVYRRSLHSTQLGGWGIKQTHQTSRLRQRQSSPAERHSLRTSLRKQGEVTRRRRHAQAFLFLPDGNAVREMKGWGKAPGFIRMPQSGGVRPTATLMDRLNARRREDLRIRRAPH